MEISLNYLIIIIEAQSFIYYYHYYYGVQSVLTATRTSLTNKRLT